MENYIFQNVIDNLYDAVYVVDKERKIIMWNKACEKITGYTKEDVLNKYCFDNILNHVDDHGKNLCKTKCPLMKTIEDGEARKAQLYLHHKQGYRVPILIKTTPLYDENNIIIGAIEIFSDNVVKMLEIEKMKALVKEAYMDDLLKIGNRKYAHKKLENITHSLSGTDLTFGLIMVKMKPFSRYKKETGIALQALSNTLSHNIRPMDVITYWSDHVFLLMIEKVTKNVLTLTVNKLKSLIENTTCVIEKTPYPIFASIAGKIVGENMSIEQHLHYLEQMIDKMHDKEGTHSKSDVEFY